MDRTAINLGSGHEPYHVVVEELPIGCQIVAEGEGSILYVPPEARAALAAAIDPKAESPTATDIPALAAQLDEIATELRQLGDDINARGTYGFRPAWRLSGHLLSIAARLTSQPAQACAGDEGGNR